MICILGMADIRRLIDLPHLFINKMMPEHDFGAITCWYEYLHNRTYLNPTSDNDLNLKKDFYLSLPHIRYHYMKMLNNGSVDGDDFDCNIEKNVKDFIDV